MTALPLTSVHYPAIRAAIDVTLTAELVPDAVIALDVYVGAATRAVQARDPLWATRTGDDAIRLTTAAILLTAAALAPAVPQIVSERWGDQTYQRQPADMHALAAALRARADAALATVLAPSDAASDRPTMFTLASGRRGR